MKNLCHKRWVDILQNLPLGLQQLVAGVARLIFLSPITSPVGHLLSGLGGDFVDCKIEDLCGGLDNNFGVDCASRELHDLPLQLVFLR